MIFEIDEIRGLLPELAEMADDALELTLRGIEQAVKGATNNDFSRHADPITGEIEWPDDIKLGVLNLLKWDAANRDTLGIASETLSRHSVSYSQMTGADARMGYPKALTGFLRPYERARF